MINYNPKQWFYLIAGFHKGDTLRKLWPLLLFMGCYSWLVVFLEVDFLKLEEGHEVKNIPQMHSLLGFAISMLLVFRTNTAYDRWWEGRKLWGSLINNSRNFAIHINALLPNEDNKNRSFFKKLIPRFAEELRFHLQAESTRLELDEDLHPEIPHFDSSKHIPVQVSSLMLNKVNILYKEGKISDAQLINLNTELQSFLDICGSCERIKNTPIPYSYSSFIKKFIFIYMLTMPLGLALSLGYLTIPIVAFVFYVLASLEIIAAEIEDPFGKDANDLPMQRLTATIKKNVEDIL
ncbi:bestrophin family protein [Parasediminibacterium sp. JCM 36343]|uniref:bestrophin family protein n=1 Tax=Parasediminibacterium sp. JCM 36343 TaxID=3374279 RepID=UPI00397E3E71